MFTWAGRGEVWWEILQLASLFFEADFEIFGLIHTEAVATDCDGLFSINFIGEWCLFALSCLHSRTLDRGSFHFNDRTRLFKEFGHFPNISLCLLNAKRRPCVPVRCVWIWINSMVNALTIQSCHIFMHVQYFPAFVCICLHLACTTSSSVWFALNHARQLCVCCVYSGNMVCGKWLG